MKIALVHDFLFSFGGAERVLAVFHELFPDAPIYTAFAYPEIVEKHFPRATIISSSLQKNPLRRWPQFLFTSMPRAIESFDLSGFDVVLSSSGAFSHGVITGPDTVHISYCHSPMRYAWDWHHEYLKERGLNRPLVLPIARHALSNLRLWDTVSAERVDIFLANSQVVADRINKFYRREASVVHPPVDMDFFNPTAVKEQPSQPYAVSISRLTPNKRIDVIIEACALAGMPLKIAGKGSHEGYLKKLVAEKGDLITFLGPVSEEEKRSLLAGAQCFIFAAEDDFGIGPAEALAMGVPVISLKKGGIQEVLQEGNNAYYFTEPTPASLAKALKLFAAEPLSWSSEKIRSHAEELSLQHFKDAIIKQVSHANDR